MHENSQMVTMAIKFSSIEMERLALVQAVERFRSRAVSELWFLKDRLPRSEPLERNGGNHALAASVETWAEARQQHHLARHGLILWQADFVPPASPVIVLRNEEGRPGASDWFPQPRAA